MSDVLYSIVMMESLPAKENISIGKNTDYIPGIFTTFEKAEHHILENSKNINEDCYTYAIIEEVEVDKIYPMAGIKAWYKFNEGKGTYEQIEEVETYLCNFSIG